MAKHISLHLADLSPQKSYNLPLDLLLAWEQGEKSLKRQEYLLAPYKIRGTLVASDAAGLSKLCMEKSLLQALKLIHEPKKVIYAFGKQCGGTPVGTWAADNTSMFYDEHIPVTSIIDAMIRAQSVLATYPVQAGLGIHHGTFYKIGTDYYGEEAHFLEDFAENHTEAGEIAISAVSLPPKGQHQYHIEKKEVLHDRACVRIIYEPQQVPLPEVDTTYPLPFPSNFADFLENSSVASLSQLSSCPAPWYHAEQYVLFIHLQMEPSPFLLDHFTTWLLAHEYIQRTGESYEVHTVKCAGPIAIVLSKDAQTAFSYARSLYEGFQTQQIHCTIGICKGPVLLFSLDEHKEDIASDAVNKASKLAEDSGLSGILLEESVQHELSMHTFAPFSLTISRVCLSGGHYH